MTDGETPPMCLGPGGELAAEHEARHMTPTRWDDDAWECPECHVIVRTGGGDD